MRDSAAALALAQRPSPFTCSEHPEAERTPGKVAYAITQYVTHGKVNTVTEPEVRCSECSKKYLRRRGTSHRLPPYTIIAQLQDHKNRN